MVCVLIDGFDKYGEFLGPLALGEWLTTGAATNFVTGAYSKRALRCGGGPFGNAIHHNLPNNYPTLIIGCRIRSSLSNTGGIEFRDGGSPQFSVAINTLGRWVVSRSGVGGSGVFTSASSVTANTWHYVELKVTFHNTSGQYALWIDGVNIVTSAADQNTIVTANHYANAIALSMTGNSQMDYDDLYVFDTTGSFNNTVAGDSVVETQYPDGDSSVQFSVGEASIGSYYTNNNTAVAPTGQEIFLRTFTPDANCTLNSVSFFPFGSNGGARFTGLVFADNAGLPGTLLTSTPEQVGAVSGVPVTVNLNAPQSLTAGVPIWLAFMQNAGFSVYLENGSNLGYFCNYTYSLGPPVTCPTVTSGQASWAIYGNVTTSSNFTEVKNLDDVADTSLRNYISSDVVGAEDLYTFPALTSIPISVSAIKVSAFCQKSDAGSRQLDLKVKSGVTDGSGDTTNQPMSATFEYLSSIFDSDPASGLQWNATTVNNALSGIKVSG